MSPRRTTEELIRIVAAGGGVHINTAGYTTEQLIRIAAASRNSGARLAFAVVDVRTTEELIRIGAAGEGRVTFIL